MIIHYKPSMERRTPHFLLESPSHEDLRPHTGTGAEVGREEVGVLIQLDPG